MLIRIDKKLNQFLIGNLISANVHRWKNRAFWFLSDSKLKKTTSYNHYPLLGNYSYVVNKCIIHTFRQAVTRLANTCIMDFYKKTMQNYDIFMKPVVIETYLHRMLRIIKNIPSNDVTF